MGIDCKASLPTSTSHSSDSEQERVRPALRCLFARTRREMVEGAACGALNAPILCVSIPLAVRRLGGWSLHPVVLPSGPITGARHGCTAQAFEITVTLRLHPQSGRYVCRPWRGAEQGLLLLSHTIARLQSAPWRKGVPSANACCAQVLPIVRYGHMLIMTADLPARDTAALLPNVAQNSSTRDGWKCHALEESDVKPLMLSITAILIPAEGPA